MSGHSKWSTIKRQKGATDTKRGAIFTKLGNNIAIAVREGGGGDPESNFKLRLAIEKAREANMPKENIQRSIDRGLGKGGAAAPETTIFEGFGPGGVAVLVETVTDNKTRTGSELRSHFDKAGGSLGSTGSVAYLFKHLGEIEVSKNNQTFEKIFEAAVEAGAEDVEENPETFSIYTKPEDLHKVKDSLKAAGFPIESAELVYKPNPETMVTLDDVKKTSLENFLTMISDLDAVQNVFANF